MLELHPFTGHVVTQERAHRVVAPPYDALEPAARAALAATDPDSYLGALPPGTAADAGELDVALERCRHHLDRLIGTGRYRALPRPTIGVLRFTTARAEPAVAIVGDVPVGAFAALDAPDAPGPPPDTPGPPTATRTGGPADPERLAPDLVRPHERVHDDRVAQLARYLEVVGVASSPVALTQRPHPDVTAATDRVTTDPPDLAYRATDGVDVALWCVTDPALHDQLIVAVAAAGPAYLADGHHRGAAARRHAHATGAGPDDPAGRVLCAVLPSDHLAVHAFHRRFDDVLRASAGHADAEVAALLARLVDVGVGVTEVAGPTAPAGPHEVTLTAEGDWWHLDVTALVRTDDPVEALDVRLVDRDLAPLLIAAATPPGPRAVPVPAPFGLDALVGPGAVGIALHPPPVDTVLAVAESGRCLPPKTTYVLPKLRSGLVVTPRSGPARPTGA